VQANHNKMTSPARKYDSHSQTLLSMWPLLLIGLVVIVVGITGDSGRLALRYDRLAVESGQWWRLLSGHIVHLGWQHALLNLAGLTLVILLFPDEYRAGQWLTLVVVCVAVISAGFLFLRPDLNWYVGLSGVLHGLFWAGAIRWLSRREAEGYLLVAFLIGKLIWEQMKGALPLSVATSGGPVVVDAHLYGAVAGIGLALLFLRDWRSTHR